VCRAVHQRTTIIVWDANRLTECESGKYDVLYSGPMSRVTYNNPVSSSYEREVNIVKNEDSLFALKVD